MIFKRFLFLSLAFSVFMVFVILGYNNYKYEQIKHITNARINSIVSIVKNKYPDLSQNDIIEILEGDEIDEDILREYGYNYESDYYIQELERTSLKGIVELSTLLVVVFGGVLLLWYEYNNRIHKEIKDLISLVERINQKKYDLELENYNEGELSILRSEIYKMTIMLKEAAENSHIDKLNLKNSLSDISHQLKTPLTSILIMLDAIIEDENMEKNVKDNFIKDIKREIININFLVQSILKLSKFDANVVTFVTEEVNLTDIVVEAVKNVSLLSDLKNVKISIKGECNKKIECDFRWQVEAVSNILKNCVEHSFENSEVIVEVSENKVYSSITIKDFGRGMDKKDLTHIFDRFYKGKNSSLDSVGIGLSLSKSIVEATNGNLSVESEFGKGAVFSIKYFR